MILALNIDHLTGNFGDYAYPKGIDDRHAATIRFLMDVVDLAIVFIHNSPPYREAEKACIINWASATTNWCTMHDLVDLLKFTRHLPDADVFASASLIDWSSPKVARVDQLIRGWQAASTGQEGTYRFLETSQFERSVK